MTYVRKPPFDRNTSGTWRQGYVDLRCAVFDTIEDAQKACIEATRYNPVGHRVLRVVGDSFCKNCCGSGGLIPQAVRNKEVPFFSEWEHDVCEDCNGNGFIESE